MNMLGRIVAKLFTRAPRCRWHEYDNERWQTACGQMEDCADPPPTCLHCGQKVRADYEMQMRIW